MTDSSLTKFSTPAGIGDFDHNPLLKNQWDTLIANYFEDAFEYLKKNEGVAQNQICFF